MATCLSCSKSLPDGVSHCPYCGTEQAKVSAKAEKKTMFGYAPSPGELQNLAAQASAAAAPPAAAPPIATPPVAAAPPMAAPPAAAPPVAAPPIAAPPMAAPPVAAPPMAAPPMAAPPVAAAPAAAPAATKAAPSVTIPGVELAEGEYPIAIEHPGAAFWILFVIFAVTVLLLPLALWMMFVTAGKRYIITNRRSIRVTFTGKVLDLPHDQLAGFKVKGFMGASNMTLRLKNAKGPDLTFGLCGPLSALSRLWGNLYLWVLSPDVDIAQAPAVDASGTIIDREIPIDVALFEKSQFRRGTFDLSGAQSFGVTIVTPNRFIWLLGRHAGDEDAAELPVYAFALSAAKRAASVEAFEAEIERVAKAALAESVSRRWDRLVDPKANRAGLIFEDKGKKCTLGIFNKADREALKTYVKTKTSLALD